MPPPFVHTRRELHARHVNPPTAGRRRRVEAVTFYWPVVFVIVAVGAAFVGFLDTGAPNAHVARLISFVFFALAAALTIARRWHRSIHRP